MPSWTVGELAQLAQPKETAGLNFHNIFQFLNLGDEFINFKILVEAKGNVSMGIQIFNPLGWLCGDKGESVEDGLQHFCDFALFDPHLDVCLFFHLLIFIYLFCLFGGQRQEQTEVFYPLV